MERIPVPPSPGGSTSAGGGIFNTYFHPIPKVRRNDNEIAILLAAYQEYYSED